MIEVTYVDHMGSDLSVVNAARVSFGKKSDWMPRVHNGEQLVLTPKDAKVVKELSQHLNGQSLMMIMMSTTQKIRNIYNLGKIIKILLKILPKVCTIR